MRTAVIRQCRLRGGSIYANAGGSYGSLVLEDSVIEKTTDEIGLWYPVRDCSIQRNIFLSSGGILVGTDGSVRVLVANNIFWEPANFGWEGAVISWACYDSSLILVQGNTFLTTNRVALRIEPGYSTPKMIATNNFWNTSDTNIINGMIFDKRDNTNCVNFIGFRPFLTEPDPMTPVLLPATITTQPASQVVNPGTNVSFSVVADGIGELNYQWQFNGLNLPGRTNAVLWLSNVTSNHAGSYTVVVGNFLGLAATSAVATLTVNFSLDINSTPYGSVQHSPDWPAYPSNALVTLMAVPAPGYGFIRWSGDARGSANPLVLTMDGNKLITAVFASLALTVSTQGVGMVAKAPDKVLYDLSEEVTLTATPGRWHAFSRWGDGVTNNPRLVTIGESNIYMAVFAPTTALETVTFGGVSRLAPVGVPAIFVDGRFVVSGPVTNGDSAQVSMSSSFPEGHIFYVVEAGGTSSPFTFYDQPLIITNSTTIRATAYSSDLSRVAEADPLEVIILPTYTLAATSAGGGTVTLDPAAGRYLSNMAVRVTAVPGVGWSFLRWTGDAGGTNRSITVDLNRNKAVQAVFGTALNTVAQGPGSVVLQPDRPFNPFGANVRLTAVPQAGYQFMLWGNAASGSTNPLDFVVRSATQTVAALFLPLSANQVTLTVLERGQGQVLRDPGLNVYANGQTVSLTATPDPAFAFMAWSGDATGTQNPLTVTLNGNKSVTALFTNTLALGIARSTEGCLLTVTVAGLTNCSIETSTDLSEWTSLTNLGLTLGHAQFSDSAVTNGFQRFYRATLPR
jgi:hypothetical protein